MGQAKRRKAEIDILKANGPKKKVVSKVRYYTYGCPACDRMYMQDHPRTAEEERDFKCVARSCPRCDPEVADAFEADDWDDDCCDTCGMPIILDDEPLLDEPICRCGE